VTGHLALVIVDMQRAMSPEYTGPRNNPDAEGCIERLLDAWRGRGLPVVHVHHRSLSPNGAFRPEHGLCDVQPRFQPGPDEHRLEKTVPDAFAHSGLEDWLLARQVRQLVVVGVSTNNSVEATVRAAACLGFEVSIPADACFTFDKTDILGVSRPAEDWHVIALSNLQGEYAAVTTTNAVLTQIG
jgi:nicotinamidase-related amidase